MIYFDNAATGGFKAAAVTEAAVTAVKYLCANPGRSGHRLSLTGAKAVLGSRMSLAKMFGAEDADRVIFTKNATEALNLALQGTAKRNGHVVTTIYEHNSVWRTLTHLSEEYGVRVSVTDGTAEAIKAALTADTYLVMVNHVSNVTGREADLAAIANALKGTDAIFAVDCAQSAGHTPIDMKKCGINVLCAAGHKGMGGIMGSGFLIFDKNTEIRPVLFGGTGTESLNTSQPLFYPERLESGTLNLPAVAALGEAAEYVQPNLKIFAETLYTLTDALVGELQKIPKVRLYSEPNKFGIVSFAADGTGSSELADILSSEYDIAVRGGLHCAPMIHRHLGTERDGLVRVSFAPQNSLREVSAFVKALRRILQGV
ncbi:MAG: cysteine desulfurase [Bacillota bacterium]|nr:MAG: cysteine desulfurase [Bacillota bacterium]